MRGLLQSVLRSQVFQGFRSEVMTFQKEKTLPFVGYFLLLAKSLENSLYMNTLNQSLRRFLIRPTLVFEKGHLLPVYFTRLCPRKSRLYFVSCMSHSQLSGFLNIFSRLDPVFLLVTWEANILWVWPALELQLELLWWHTSGRYHIYFTCFSIH